MITTLWRKHWTELRGVWIFSVVLAAFPAIFWAVRDGAHAAQMPQVFMAVFFFLMAVLTPRFAGTGLATSNGVRRRHGTDPSLLFTLSLPVRRRNLFLYRAASTLFLLETGTALGLLIGTAVLVQMGGSWQVIDHGLWLLLAIVPVYFLDCLLSIRFTEANIICFHLGCVLGLAFVLPFIHMTPLSVLAALSGISPVSFVLSVLLIAGGLTILMVWNLDRQDY